MKTKVFRIEAIAFGCALLWISALQSTAAHGPPKASAGKHTPAKTSTARKVASSAKPAPTAPTAIVHQNNTTSGGQSGSGTAPIGSELIGTQLSGSELTGSQLTGFDVGFHPPFLRSPFTFFAANASDMERWYGHSLFQEGHTPKSPPEASAVAADAASALPAYGPVEKELRSAQSDYDSVLTHIRQRLNENPTYQKARVEQTDLNSASTTSPWAASAVAPSADSERIHAAVTIARMESSTVAADPEANAARQKLDEAVLARCEAERAQAAPHATMIASGAK